MPAGPPMWRTGGHRRPAVGHQGDLDLVEQSGPKALLGGLGARQGHVLVARDRLGLCDVWRQPHLGGPALAGAGVAARHRQARVCHGRVGVIAVDQAVHLCILALPAVLLG
jgi:hypothetical protein